MVAPCPPVAVMRPDHPVVVSAFLRRPADAADEPAAVAAAGPGGAHRQEDPSLMGQRGQECERPAGSRAFSPSPGWRIPGPRSAAFTEYDNSKALTLLPQDSGRRRARSRLSRRDHSNRKVDFHSTPSRIQRNRERGAGTRERGGRAEILVRGLRGLPPYDEQDPGHVRTRAAAGERRAGHGLRRRANGRPSPCMSRTSTPTCTASSPRRTPCSGACHLRWGSTFPENSPAVPVR